MSGSVEPVSLDPMRRLAVALGHTFLDERLLRQALTHRSYVNECEDASVRDNERLEFLGDAVIDLVLSAALMEVYPEAREGELSKMRAALVSEEALADKARALGLGGALRLGRGEEISGGRGKPSLLSDAFEAVVAAVYIDAGIEAARQVLLRLFSFEDLDVLTRADPKTELQQLVQGLEHKTPTYRLVATSGPDHDKEFLVELKVEDRVLARGRGRTKKDAEQDAARIALTDFTQA